MYDGGGPFSTEPCVTLAYSKYRESLEYSLHGTLCKPCHLRTQGIFRALPNIYNGEFYSEPCVIPAYIEPC